MIKGFIKHNTGNFLAIAVAFLYFPFVQELNKVKKAKRDQQLQIDGAKAVAKVTDVYVRKSGYNIHYTFYSAEGRLIELSEGTEDILKGKEQEIKTGNCYPVMYDKVDPQIRKVDFSSKVSCNSASYYGRL